MQFWYWGSGLITQFKYMATSQSNLIHLFDEVTAISVIVNLKTQDGPGLLYYCKSGGGEWHRYKDFMSMPHSMRAHRPQADTMVWRITLALNYFNCVNPNIAFSN